MRKWKFRLQPPSGHVTRLRVRCQVRWQQREAYRMRPYLLEVSMYKDERGIASKVSNEGGSGGKLVITSNRLDWVRRVAQSGFGPALFGPWVRLSRRTGMGARLPWGSRPRFQGHVGADSEEIRAIHRWKRWISGILGWYASCSFRYALFWVLWRWREWR